MSFKRVVLTLVAAAAIGVSPAAADRGKPSAPVTLTAVAERGPDGWRVVIDAAPTRDVGGVELEVAGRRTRFGSTAARRARHLVVPVDVAAGAGQDVVVVARVGGRTKSLTVRVGAPAPVVAKQKVTVRVINGITIAEVRE
jgi:hypothetical protein